MKKIILVVMVTILALGGCSRMTPSVASTVAQLYDTTKTILVKGQEVVIINSDLLDTELLKEIDKIDETAKRINDTVQIISQ